MTVHTILARKGSTVYTIEPTASIAHAAKFLAEHGIGALVVTGAEGRTVGIVSERDIVRALAARGGAALDTRPLLIRQVARIAQMISIVFRSVLIRPHRRPPLESGPPFLKHNRFNRFNKF